jgi:hypothetical protein
VKWIVKNFGADILVAVRDGIQSQWRRVFASKNILILGPRQTGKSSLMLFVQSGTPYEVIKGEIRPPDPTAAAMIVDSKFTLQKDNWLKLKKDVPGDLDLRRTWATAIADIKPIGIIYMIDGRRPREFAALIDEVFSDVLVHYRTSLGHLLAFHVFINFGDQWATTPSIRREAVAKITELFETRAGDYAALAYLRFACSVTQLSPHKRSWEETTRAIYHFGADLIE